MYHYSYEKEAVIYYFIVYTHAWIALKSQHFMKAQTIRQCPK